MTGDDDYKLSDEITVALDEGEKVWILLAGGWIQVSKVAESHPGFVSVVMASDDSHLTFPESQLAAVRYRAED